MDSPGPVPWASLTHRTGAKRRKAVRERCLLFETSVTFCGIVGLRATVLGRLGGRFPPIQERVLYPAHRPPVPGRVTCTSPGPASCLGQSLYRTDQKGARRAQGAGVASCIEPGGSTRRLLILRGKPPPR